jgi:hypothetical protein
MAVDDFFYDNNFFPYLDYEFTGRVFHDVIYFNIAFNTTEAKRLADKLPHLTVSLDDKEFHTAIIQIGSELEHNLGVAGKDTPDWDAVRDELRGIEARPWRSIDDIDVINPRDVRLVPGSLYVPQDKTKMPARKVKVTYALDPTFAERHKDLLPLYWQLAILMSENIKADLYAKFGFYSKGITRKPKHRVNKLIHLFHISPLVPLDLPYVREMIELSLLALRDAKAFKRLAADLRLATHDDTDHILPGPHYMFERTDVLIGAKGWHRIATDENCGLILSHMKVTVSTGRERASTKIGSVLDL